MKKLLFSLLMMVALLMVTTAVRAQGDKYNPVKGSIYTYTVGGLNAGDEVDFYLNQSISSPSGTIGGIMTDQSTEVASDGTAEVTIEWTGNAGTYNLWIVVTGAGVGSCTNQSYKPINVIDNNFNAAIIALGTSTNTEYPSWSSAPQKSTDCPAYSTGASFETTGSDGSSYVFFKVSKTADNNGAWDLLVSCPGADLIEYYVGAAWTTTAPADLPDATQYVLVRITEANVPEGFGLIASVTATEDNGAASIADNNAGDNSFNISINPIPDMSGITFN